MVTEDELLAKDDRSLAVLLPQELLQRRNDEVGSHALEFQAELVVCLGQLVLSDYVLLVIPDELLVFALGTV